VRKPRNANPDHGSTSATWAASVNRGFDYDRAMARKRSRDLERSYTARQFAAKLRRLAAAVERQRPFTIQIAGERLSVPKGAVFNVEHERSAGGIEEVEFQLRWRRDADR
jgi:amphi-Trp domain-containing protein